MTISTNSCDIVKFDIQQGKSIKIFVKMISLLLILKTSISAQLEGKHTKQIDCDPLIYYTKHYLL